MSLQREIIASPVRSLRNVFVRPRSNGGSFDRIRGLFLKRRAAGDGSRSRFGQGGFTLLEVLIVLVILGLVAAVVVGPKLFTQLDKAKWDTAKIKLDNIGGGLDLYRLNVGRYPTQEEGLDALIEAPRGVNGWAGPYLTKRDAIIDPWGNEYHYRIPGQHGEYDLYSLGADNADGGEGTDRDITNW